MTVCGRFCFRIVHVLISFNFYSYATVLLAHVFKKRFDGCICEKNAVSVYHPDICGMIYLLLFNECFILLYFIKQ